MAGARCDSNPACGAPSRARAVMVLAVVLAAMLACGLVGPGANDAAGATTWPSATRYVDRVFASTDASLDLVYRQAIDYLGNPVDLTLDLYRPHGDSATRRPAVIWMHGGFWAFGDKKDLQSYAVDSARRGYVGITMNYRLRKKSSVIDATNDAYDDSIAAVQWLQAHAVEYGVDPSSIVVGGHSAGAINALNVVFTPGSRGPVVSPAAGAIAIAGTSTKTPSGPRMPIEMFHGTADTIVPYASGQKTCDQTIAAGNTCDFVTYPGEDHGIVSTEESDIQARSAHWIVDRILVPKGRGPGGRFHPLVPTRVLDSRTATGGWSGPLAAGSPRSLPIAGVGGVPAPATAVVLNVTVTNAGAGSFLTVYPAGASPPTASNLNFGPAETVANLVTVGMGASGAVTLANAVGTTDVVADVLGYYDTSVAAGDRFNGVTPARVLDSRTTNGSWSGPLPAGDANVRSLVIRGRGGVPTSATSVVLDVAVTGATAGSFVQVWPTGQPRPVSSTVNFGAGATVANLTTTPIGADGTVSFFNAVGTTDVVADVVGYYDPTTGALFHPLPAPARVLDDRTGLGLAGPFGPAQTRAVAIGGTSCVPSEAGAVVVNLTATNATTGSFLTIFPNGTPRPNTSNVNVGPGATVANLAITSLPANGKANIYNALGSVDVIADVAGWFAAW